MVDAAEIAALSDAKGKPEYAVLADRPTVWNAAATLIRRDAHEDTWREIAKGRYIDVKQAARELNEAVQP